MPYIKIITLNSGKRNCEIKVRGKCFYPVRHEIIEKEELVNKHNKLIERQKTLKQYKKCLRKKNKTEKERRLVSLVTLSPPQASNPYTTKREIEENKYLLNALNQSPYDSIIVYWFDYDPKLNPTTFDEDNSTVEEEIISIDSSGLEYVLVNDIKNDFPNLIHMTINKVISIPESVKYLTVLLEREGNQPLNFQGELTVVSEYPLTLTSVPNLVEFYYFDRPISQMLNLYNYNTVKIVRIKYGITNQEILNEIKQMTNLEMLTISNYSRDDFSVPDDLVLPTVKRLKLFNSRRQPINWDKINTLLPNLEEITCLSSDIEHIPKHISKVTSGCSSLSSPVPEHIKEIHCMNTKSLNSYSADGSNSFFVPTSESLTTTATLSEVGFAMNSIPEYLRLFVSFPKMYGKSARFIQ